MTAVAPGVFRRRREVSEVESIVNEALCGLPWEEAQILRPKMLAALGLRSEVEEIFREAQRKSRP